MTRVFPRARTFTAIVLFTVAFVLFLGSVAVRRSFAQSGKKPFDPWNPDRKFCGRLTIIIAGAGTEPVTYTQGEKGVDSDLTDLTSNRAYSNFQQFRRNDANSLPGYSIVFTSEARLKSKLDTLPKDVKGESGFLGVALASKDSFQEFLSNDSKVSLLAKAIANFKENAGCQRLQQSEGLSSVLPLLKTEIIYSGQNADEGMQVWSKKSGSGIKDDSGQKNELSTSDKELIATLRQRLGGSVVHVFIDSCRGATIAEQFQSQDQCSCYLSVTDPDTLLYVGADKAPALAGYLPHSGGDMRALRSKSLGAESIGAMNAQLYSSFEFYTAGGTNRYGRNSIFSENDRINPLMAFAYNSADFRAERVLRKFIKKKEKMFSFLPDPPVEEGSPEATAKALLAAGFTEALPPRLTLPQNVDPGLTRILKLTASLRNSYASYAKDVSVHANGSDFAVRMRAFRACAGMKHPEPAFCGAMNDVLNKAIEGSGGGGLQVQGDINLIEARDDFFKVFDGEDAPTLVARYERGKITINALFTKLHSIAQLYDVYWSVFNSYAGGTYKKQIPSELTEVTRALAEMNKPFHIALQGVQQEFFSLLRKEALEVRLAKIEEAAKMLSLHEQEGLDAKEELRQLGNDLVCLIYYPVGPAFDKLKFDSPVSPLRTGSGEALLRMAK